MRLMTPNSDGSCSTAPTCEDAAPLSGALIMPMSSTMYLFIDLFPLEDGWATSPPVRLRGATLAEAGMPNGRQVTQLPCALAVDPLNLVDEHLHDRLDSVP